MNTAYFKHPWIGVLYVLIYWNWTLFIILIGTATVLALADISRPTQILLYVLATGVASFNLGFTVGQLRPPSGKRR
jgi:hypothetical protein